LKFTGPQGLCRFESCALRHYFANQPDQLPRVDPPLDGGSGVPLLERMASPETFGPLS